MTHDEWTPVLPLEELAERRPRSVRAGDVDVLLYRIGEQILAIGNRCTHQGALLDKGAIKELGSQIMVTCAAHGSVFRLADGSVARGPAMVPEPAYDVRLGEEGSGGSTPLKVGLRRAGGKHTEELFAKLYSATHLRADRWYKLGRTIRYGALEDESSFNTVRRLVEHEDYMLRLMREAGVSAVEPRGIVELEPEREYVILMTLLRRAEEADEEAPVDDSVIDAGLRIVRAMWDHGLAHRDLKPANILIHDGEVSLIDVAFGEIRPSPWRQAVDLANMMLVLALPTDPDRVYARAVELFSPNDIGEAFAAANGPAIPRQLRQKLADDDRDLLGRFRELAPDREPISIQRWSLRRVALAAQAAAVAAALLVLLAFNLANPTAP